MNGVYFFDSTLRDGSHAISHQIDAKSIKEYCCRADKVGMYTIIVGHGNGLGASSLQVGLSALTDRQMLVTARKELKKTKLGVFLIPGFGTIKEDLAPAIDIGVDLVCVATHCTEADITQQHIEYVKKKGKEAYGILMMQHMLTKEKLLEQTLKMQEYGAQGVVLMDSAGASIPEEVSEKIKFLAENLNIRVGFHAHNNLGMAIANSYYAIKSGAGIIDGTMRGFGAGAGNCQLEALAAILCKIGNKPGLDLYKMMDISDEIVAKMMRKAQEISSVSLISGLAGVFSGFANHVKKASEKFGVDPRDIFMELGRRKMVAGQEDFIVDVAMYLAQKKKAQKEIYQIESLL